MRILIILLGIIFGAIHLGAQNQRYPEMNGNIGPNDKVTYIHDDYYFIERGSAESIKTRAENNEQTYKVTIEVETEASNQYIMFVNLYSSFSDGIQFSTRRVGASTFEAKVTNGEYDIFCLLADAHDMSDIIIGRDNFVIDSDTEINLSVSEATSKTYLKIVDPFGDELIRYRDEIPGNSEGATFRTFMHRSNMEPVIEGCAIGYEDKALYVRIDPTLKAFTVGCEHMRFNEKGFFYAAYMVDPSKDEVSTTQDKWISMEPEFAPNILSEKWYTYCTEYTDRVPLWPNTFGRYSCGDNFGTGVGIGRAGIPNKIWLWQDAEDTYFKMWPQAVSTAYSQNSAIEGMLLEYTSDGFVFSGVNDVLSCAYLRDIFGHRTTCGNPRFKGNANGIVLGNSAPNAIFSFDIEPDMYYPDFSYSFLGRYGEKRNADAVDIYSSFSSFLSEIDVDNYFDNPTHDLEVYVDGELLVSSAKHYNTMSWEDETLNVDWSRCQNAKINVRLTDKNILVDDIVGSNYTELNYDRGNKDDAFPPQLMMIQFRNSKDEVCDRFEYSDEGIIEFYTGDFTPVLSTSRIIDIVNILGDIPQVKLEYAPFGSDDFEEIEVAEVPELFFMPGYGYCFRGSLSKVSKPSDNKWYAIRITLTDAAGNSNVQTITPAFRVENSVSGMDSFKATDTEVYEVYTISGYKVISTYNTADIKNLDPGVYVIRHAGETSKKIVR